MDKEELVLRLHEIRVIEEIVSIMEEMRVNSISRKELDDLIMMRKEKIKID